MRLARYEEMHARGFFPNRTTARRMVEKGFPRPIELGPNMIAWDLDEAESHVATLPRRMTSPLKAKREAV